MTGCCQRIPTSRASRCLRNQSSDYLHCLLAEELRSARSGGLSCRQSCLHAAWVKDGGSFASENSAPADGMLGGEALSIHGLACLPCS